MNEAPKQCDFLGQSRDWSMREILHAAEVIGRIAGIVEPDRQLAALARGLWLGDVELAIARDAVRRTSPEYRDAVQREILRRHALDSSAGPRALRSHRFRSARSARQEASR